MADARRLSGLDAIPKTIARSFTHWLTTHWPMDSTGRRAVSRLSDPRVGRVFGDPKYAGDLKKYGKEWWEQAEMLTALSTAYRHTHDQRYLNALEKEWSWVWNYEIDHKAGDWYEAVDFNTGKPLASLNGDSGGWKCDYHDGRAMMNLVTELDAILDKARAIRHFTIRSGAS